MSRASPALALALATALACMLLGSRAHAQAAEPPPVPDEVQRLYQSALQSIAEGRKNDALDTLEQVISQEAQHAGAWLDLALIQCALGHQAEAERLFVHIEEHFDPPDGIRELIAESRAAGCTEWRPLSQQSFTLSRGTASNVNQGTTSSGVELGLPPDLPLTEDFLPRHDQYSALIADHMQELTANGTMGYIQLQGRRYDSLNQYDTTSLVVGVESPWRLGRWVLRGSTALAAVSLGGHLYQQQAQLQARLDTPWALPAGIKFQAGASVNRLRYTTLANFDSTAAELRGQFTWRGDDDYASVNASVLADRAIAGRPGGDRSGWTMGALWRRSLMAGSSIELAYNRQNYHGDAPYSPGLIDVVRKQDLQTVRATFSYPLGKKQAVLIEGRATRNRENVPIFQYNDRQVQVSWQWQSQ